MQTLKHEGQGGGGGALLTPPSAARIKEAIGVGGTHRAQREEGATRRAEGRGRERGEARQGGDRRQRVEPGQHHPERERDREG